MEKINKFEAQREKIARATWAVIRREGLENASVRNVAQEANLSVGSLRHYFSTQNDLLIYSMELIQKKSDERIEAMRLFGNGPSTDDILEVLRQFLPLDTERRLEMEVWLSFSSKALVDEAIRAKCQVLLENSYQMLRTMLELLIFLKEVREDLDIDVEVIRLYGLLEGMSYHCIMLPDKFTSEIINHVLHEHLQTLK
ncbi:TetR/AcrR family transcriptional regulator [Viridibacillus arvi]|uniref:TetR/AcrR family transcriptional regulator n=1 Tax=Viridibacillus arvi TaxID=263475 RepID=UPI00187B7C4C|nr:TetR family transcriptional regulator C-terminal domain-containing protein [Viridibacillus sp. JNUCC-6]QOV10286.1 TetR family transcriptional regulator C-terminal domain-containing protein [Viridibacillus sp. JNUCC-6]